MYHTSRPWAQKNPLALVFVNDISTEASGRFTDQRYSGILNSFHPPRPL